MKIALVSSSPVPPAFGGMDRLLEGLRGALGERHPTDLVTLPVDERSADGCLRGYYDFYNLDLSAYDLVMSYKAPAYMVRHPVQVLYLSHRMRVFYDLYEARGPEHARLRRLIHWLDGWALAKQRIPFVFCVGNTVSKRLLRWGGVESTPIHHPSTFKPDPPKPGEHLLAVGRLHEWKRIDLIIRALRASRADLPLKIVGAGPREAELRELAGGDPRIEFLGLVDEERLRDLYARSLVSIFPPINEDLGLITIESFSAAKPVLTTTDSGEPAEIVQHDRTGFIEEPTPEAMARRFEWIAANRSRVEAMGEACLASAAEVTWDRLVDALLAAAEKTRSSSQDSGLSTQDSALRTQHSGLRTQDSALSTQDSGLRTQDSGLRTQHSGLKSASSSPTTRSSTRPSAAAACAFTSFTATSRPISPRPTSARTTTPAPCSVTSGSRPTSARSSCR